MLFLIYVNNFYSISDFLKIMFADHISCLASNTNLNDLILYYFVYNELKEVARWFRANKMVVNVSKTKKLKVKISTAIPNSILMIMIPTNIPNLVNEIDCIYTNHPDQQDRAYKLLGVYFDEFLTFDQHTQYLLSKLNRVPLLP
jgi:hypothetical protein